MWAILLSILKIIGILLLLALLLILIFLLLFLFCPVCYKISAIKEPESYRVTGIANWCLGLVRVKAVYPEPGAVVVRVLGIPFWRSDKAKQAKAPADNSANASDSSETAEAISAASETPVSEEDSTSAESPGSAAQADNASGSSDTSGTQTTDDASSQSKDGKTKKKGSLSERIKSYYQEFTFYRDFWQLEETQALLQKALGRLKRILKSTFPRKIEANVLFGTGSPDTTGYVMAVYGIMLPYLGPQVNVTPDFEQQILQGRLKAKGHISAFTFLRHVLSVLFDKNLKILRRRFKKHKAKQQKALNNSGK